MQSLRTVHVCAYLCVQLLYTTQHRTVLIIFPLNLQTITIALMLSIGGSLVSLKMRHFTTSWKFSEC